MNFDRNNTAQQLIWMFLFAPLALAFSSCTTQKAQEAPAVVFKDEQNVPQTAAMPTFSTKRNAVECKSPTPTAENSKPLQEQNASELKRAIIKRDVAAVRKLLRQNADPNQKDTFGDTPLLNALQGLSITEPIKPNQSLAIVQRKLQREAQAQIPIVEELLKHGADANTRGRYGLIPIIEAAFWGYDSATTIKLLTLLIEHKADVNAQDEHGSTALIRASHTNKPEVVKFLLDHNANPSLADCSGETALSIAERGRFTEVVRLLKQP